MTRHTTFCFTLKPTPSQAEALARHVGAARFAFNRCLAFVRDALASKSDEGPSPFVPWSGFDLINAFNRWKTTAAAGADESGAPGLPWRTQVCQQVFEEAAVDLGSALAAFSAGRKGERKGKRARFPRFKKKTRDRPSFRLRNKGHGAKSAIRLGVGDDPRMLRLPKLGDLAVRECTRRLRRMLAKGRAKILFATVALRSSGRWMVSMNVAAQELHSALRHASPLDSPVVGIDRGLTTFAVLAEASGREVERIDAPKPLRNSLPALRKASQSLSRKKGDSRNRARARAALAKMHARIGAIRRDFVHRESTRLAKTHGRLVLEDLCTKGLMKTTLARSLADSAWAMFASVLAYKMKWRGAELMVADRFFPSTRRCNTCGHVGEKLALSERTFRCGRCGHEADRDTNAAANLASYGATASVAAPGCRSHVAAKHAETRNACGEGSADGRLLVIRETSLVEAGRAYARHPRRVVVAGTVNTL
ncbi:MAG: transposase [Myxococcales bacterium]|nr:transposase [Myxococcales bacterium]